ncbi:hypothetical protein BU24DRAFT_473400 [Aaosphaeria arxii CBS 175.79]|uniref:Uncharacterized protein n=1 Tax=Aaosphaeria arxii CBS 175.79 TaxID=1450172 RepID=A0A6A5XBE0_9PLEO|nr:uncharacterized protein BU24DRAFT_473400 [Aaosphaeria arxii CBS 175.79]KAF2010219.1 hypothetical protein BU24DRAFT_473400 [Aaosphaeria arxii CBS 175.79]
MFTITTIQSPTTIQHRFVLRLRSSIKQPSCLDIYQTFLTLDETTLLTRNQRHSNWTYTHTYQIILPAIFSPTKLSSFLPYQHTPKIMAGSRSINALAATTTRLPSNTPEYGDIGEDEIIESIETPPTRPSEDERSSPSITPPSRGPVWSIESNEEEVRHKVASELTIIAHVALQEVEQEVATRDVPTNNEGLVQLSLPVIKIIQQHSGEPLISFQAQVLVHKIIKKRHQILANMDVAFTFNGTAEELRAEDGALMALCDGLIMEVMVSSLESSENAEGIASELVLDLFGF